MRIRAPNSATQNSAIIGVDSPPIRTARSVPGGVPRRAGSESPGLRSAKWVASSNISASATSRTSKSDSTASNVPTTLHSSIALASMRQRYDRPPTFSVRTDPSGPDQRAGSAGQKRQPHLAVVVVDVEVDQADALPGAELQSATDHRDRGVWRDQRGHHVGTPVTGAPVLVSPPAVGRKQLIECREQVVVAAGAGLEDGDPGRGVRHENVSVSYTHLT